MTNGRFSAHSFHATQAELNQSFVSGLWMQAKGPRVLGLVDPHSEADAGSLVASESGLVDQAVRAARDALREWSRSPRTVRRNALEGLIQGIEARREIFAQTISAEIGAPIDFCHKQQVAAALAHLRATLAALECESNDSQLGPDPAHRVRYEAMGVAALITPWNWPLNQVVLKVGGALAAGCPMVLKPSEYATRTAVLFAQVMAELDLPAGVFNLVIGDGQTGADLVAHPGVDVVSFTGSTRAGSHIAATAAARFARTTLELGGKSPNLLFADCDLETAMTQGVAHCFRNSGQSCNAASRMLVERQVYDRAVALAAEIARATPLGAPAAPGPHLGPLVNRAQYERVQGYLDYGVTSDARLISGGPGRADGFAQGYYVTPTVFADVTPENRLFQEEIFGPVLTMTPFDGEDQAIALANQTPYGLAAYVQTSDPARADRVSRQLNAGMIQVNGTSRVQGAPFGGRGASGQGREAGIWGIRAFQDIKSISGAARMPQT